MKRTLTILAVIMLAGSSLGFMTLIQRRRAAAVSGAAPPTPERYTNSVLFMPFDPGDVTGLTNFADKSDYANNGTSTNPPTWNAALGGYCVFDGAGNYIGIPDSASLDVQAITMGAWVYNTDTNAAAYVLAKMNDFVPYTGQMSYGLSWDGSKWSIVIWDRDDVRTSETVSSVPLLENTWTYISATYDTGTYSFYADGIKRVSNGDGNAAQLIKQTNGVLRIGCRYDSSDVANKLFWPGRLDEVTIVPYAATSNQIWAAYLAGSTNGTGVH